MTRTPPRLRRFLRAGLVATATALSACRAGVPADGPVVELRVADQTSHWADRGYVEMVSTIPLPMGHDGRGTIRTILFVPEGGRLDSRYLADQDRHVLTYPPGTRAARVESVIYDREHDDMTLTDVRGMWLRDADVVFYVLRPMNGRPEVPLLGWAWRKGDEHQQQEATRLLLSHVGRASTPIGRAPYDRRELAELASVNDCAGCHEPNRSAERVEAEAKLARGATDSAGLYFSSSVLDDASPVSDHRPVDRIAEDPFVEVRCGRTAVRATGPGPVTCSNGRVPVATRDFARALEHGHAYTHRVCASRAWLGERMTERALEAFRGSLRSCRIEDGLPQRGLDREATRRMLTPTF